MYRSAFCLALFLLVAPEPARAQWVACGRDLSREASDQAQPRAVPNGNGGAIVAWDDHRNNDDPLAYPDIFARAISATGSPLGAIGGTPICTAPHAQHGPRLASDGSGG